MTATRKLAAALAGKGNFEIFGGDAIIRADGKAVIVDVNAWPSYARYRDRAADAIANLLTERFERRPRLVAASRS